MSYASLILFLTKCSSKLNATEFLFHKNDNSFFSGSTPQSSTGASSRTLRGTGTRWRPVSWDPDCSFAKVSHFILSVKAQAHQTIVKRPCAVVGINHLWGIRIIISCSLSFLLISLQSFQATVTLPWPNICRFLLATSSCEERRCQSIGVFAEQKPSTTQQPDIVEAIEGPSHLWFHQPEFEIRVILFFLRNCDRWESTYNKETITSISNSTANIRGAYW